MCLTRGPRVAAVLGLAAAAWVALNPGNDAPGITADDVDGTSVPNLRVRIVAKAVVARELFAGRLSLAEATAVFAWLNRQGSDADAEHTASLAVEADAARAVLEWSKASVGGTQPCSNIGEATLRLEGQLNVKSQAGRMYGRPAVNEADCRALMDRSAAAVRADRGRLLDRVDVGDLRLVRQAPD